MSLSRRKKNNPFKPNDRWLRITGIPATTLFATFVLSRFFEGVELLPLWQVFLSNLFITWVGWEFSLGILIWSRRKYPGIHEVKRRLGISFALYFIVTVFLDSILLLTNNHFEIFAPYHITTGDFFKMIIFGIFIAMTIGCLYEAVYFFSLWKKTAHEKEGLRQENLHSQFQSLKNQVNPHFLFNSLNSLSTLIECDKKKAIDFIHGMSQVYRYILSTDESELATVQGEIEFIRSYFYLLNTRFGDNLKEEIAISPECMQKRIPPLTLQILIENAVKHNIVSSSKPLYLKIFSSAENELTVSNNLQKKTNVMTSNLFGLRNINNRYKLLNEPGIKIHENESSYNVSVPLIN
jgi:hypothetical protein